MKHSEHILLVEDEDSLAIGLEFNLKEEGYDVTIAPDGRRALELFESNHFDLIILDIMLPYFNGFQVAETIRGKSPQMPILMLTARTNARDRIMGLDAGADDYLTKPFHLEELLLRVKGMIKRKNWYQQVSLSQPVFRFGPNEVNFEKLSALNDKINFSLTPREAMLLKYLVEKRGKIVTRQELLKNVWQIQSNVETRTVDIFVARLRKYFEADPTRPLFIKSVRGAGYIFEIENN